uniref:Caspase domain-containing protein n=1 Tax=Candidatus Kentrum sp. LFY TaxID=2126342 RepID=A0A450W9Z7_9GAMM|nr:MAG: hypothetical protein BECKLFY1418C_GA0070996_100466 [Candidatus Kentron sp. LFY]
MSIKKQVVLVRTCHHGKTTEHLHTWAEDLKESFEENGWTVTDCESDMATREPVEKALAATKPGSVFVFYGHGGEDCLIGQDKVAVYDTKNVMSLHDCKVYVVACNTTQELGPFTVEHGAASVYFGYAEKIEAKLRHRDRRGEYVTKPMRILGRCVNSGMQAWIARPELTAAEVKQRMLDIYDYWILYYSGRNGPGIGNRWANEFSRNLLHNREALKLCGDEQARLDHT